MSTSCPLFPIRTLHWQRRTQLNRQDSDDENCSALKVPAAAAALPGSCDDLPDRPPPNKKHKCLQVRMTSFIWRPQ